MELNFTLNTISWDDNVPETEIYIITIKEHIICAQKISPLKKSRTNHHENCVKLCVLDECISQVIRGVKNNGY